MADRRTLVAVLAHPDDEVGMAGTLAAQRARGDRVVIVWLTRGEMTQAFGPIPTDEVGRRRQAQAERVAEVLDVEGRFLEFSDTRIVSGPDAAARLARLYAELRPDGILTWGEHWVRGHRHPDHRATGEIARNAVTLARIARVIEPLEPHRADCPVFTTRGVHSTLPEVVVDVEPHHALIHRVARIYFEGVGFGDPAWLDDRLAAAAAPHGLRWAESFDAWETRPGVVDALLPTEAGSRSPHPTRTTR